MAKLYPPHIEGSLPAFTASMLRIPFEHSRAVSAKDINGMAIWVKDIQNSKTVTTWIVDKANINEDYNELAFSNVPTSQIKVGQYYKIQLAYIDKTGQYGYFSDVGIIKYIQEPTIKIDNLNTVGFNAHTYHYELNYHCNDIEEKLYSTEFNLLKADTKEVIASSGEIIHNTNTDSANNYATEGYDFLLELDAGQSYLLQALVTTSSGYEQATAQYQIQAQESIASINNWMIKPIVDTENGCVNISVYSQDTVTMLGKYKLMRADEKENYAVWHTLFDTTIDTSKEQNISSTNLKLIWKDFTVEQGFNYKYALFQINSKGAYSTRYFSDAVYADFEDSFLFDGERQLRICFNPGVSSFKTTLQEVKTDTIGGHYPFIQRNSNTYYKEFPVSGLISHLTDTEGYFNKDFKQMLEIQQQLNPDRVYSTNLNSENISAERQFKLDVLKWLNNGRPKLFRSPTEGNYLVRLLNVSLSPENGLGRMLHSFSATAYEIDQADPDTLTKYDLMGNKLLSEIIHFDSSSGHISYFLNKLSELGGANLLDQQELKDAKVKQADFICGQNISQEVYVNINDSPADTNVYPHKSITGNITSIKAPVNQAFVPLSTDAIILTYEKAINLDIFNGKISSIYTEGIPCSQYTSGFDLSQIGTKLKDFFARIYQIICSPRVKEIVQIAVEALNYVTGLIDNLLSGCSIYTTIKDYVENKLGINVSTFLGDLLGSAYNQLIDEDSTLFKLLQVMINQVGIPCLEQALYIFKNNKGEIIGIFDATAKTFLGDQAGHAITQVANAAVTLVESVISNGIPKDLETVYNITAKTIFGIDSTDSDYLLSPNTKNIIANAFTCVEMVYKKAVNVIEQLSAGESLTLDYTYSGNDSLLALTKDIVEVAAGSNKNELISTAVNLCETAYNKVVSALSNGQVPQINTNWDQELNTISSTSDGSNQTLYNVASTAANLINEAVGSVGGVQGIVNTGINILSNSLNVFGGLFGGGC